MSQTHNNFWNNWDFKTLLVIAQLIGVIWLVATTYARLEAKVESNRELLNQEVMTMKDDMKYIRTQIDVLKTNFNKEFGK